MQIQKKTKKISKKHNQNITSTVQNISFDVFENKYVDMKTIIQKCHITAPSFTINCILGKKYPFT